MLHLHPGVSSFLEQYVHLQFFRILESPCTVFFLSSLAYGIYFPVRKILKIHMNFYIAYPKLTTTLLIPFQQVSTYWVSHICLEL